MPTASIVLIGDNLRGSLAGTEATSNSDSHLDLLYQLTRIHNLNDQGTFEQPPTPAPVAVPTPAAT